MESAARTVQVVGTRMSTQRYYWSPAIRRRILNIGSPILLLVIWQLLDMSKILDPQFIPAPWTVVKAMIQDASSGQLWSDLGASLYRIFLGFVLGVVPGVILGLSSGLFPGVRMFVDPLVSATYGIPKLALVPLFMLIFGLTEQEKIMLIAAGCIFPVIINTTAGVLEMDKKYFEVAKNFGASRLAYYRTVAIPGSLPAMFSGLKLAVADALLLIVAAEMVGAQSGIGYRIWISYEIMNMPMMFVSFVLMSLLGYLFGFLVEELEHFLIPWNRSRA
ncbi:MAG: ABC transporter permease [Alicyclobacillus sp.]|nr:ABC transporter permease [Alicyclobacillus sp.]